MVTDAAWAEVASKQVDAKLCRVENEVREMNKALLEAKEASVEAQDKEARRNNIILYRVPEKADGNDKRFCEQLLIGMNVGVVEEDIKRVQRLGKIADTGEISRTRPVLVQLADTHPKNFIMESLFKLKSMETKFKDIVHDMTKKSVKNVKHSWRKQNLKKNQNEAGDWVFRVRGPRDK